MLFWEKLIGIQFFDFHSTKLLHELQVPSAITALELHRDSGLLAALCDDLVIRLVDIETRRVVREFRGFKGRILDAVSLHRLGRITWTLRSPVLLA